MGGLEPDRSAEHLSRLGIVAQILEGQARAEIVVGVIRLALNRAPVRSERLVVAVLGFRQA